MLSIVFTGLLMIFTFLVYVYLKRRYSSSPDNLPGMKPHIFFGNLINAGIFTNKSTFHEVMIDYQQRYGDRFQFWYGSDQCLVFCRLEDAEIIYGDRYNFDRSLLTIPNVDVLVPHAYSQITGAKLKRHARVILPMLKREKTSAHFDSIVRSVDRFIDRDLHPDQIHRDLNVSCRSLTMNMLGSTVFNYDFDANMNLPTQQAFTDFMAYLELLILTPWVPRWLWKIYVRCSWNCQRANRMVRTFIEQIVEHEQNRRKEMENQGSKTLIAALTSSFNEEANDEQVSSGLTYAEIVDETITLLLAGFDPLANAILWFIFFVSKNPQVQERLKDELREQDLLMRDNDEYVPELTKDDLNSLTYCECVMKEVLRLGPIVPLSFRIATRDTIVDNVKIRCGQTVLIPTYNISTDPRYWHYGNSKQFIPERFLKEDRDHHRFAMLPFGGGHRACIGQELGWLGLKVAIVRLMQRGITFEDTSENINGCDGLLNSFPKHLVVRVCFDRS